MHKPIYIHIICLFVLLITAGCKKKHTAHNPGAQKKIRSKQNIKISKPSIQKAKIEKPDILDSLLSQPQAPDSTAFEILGKHAVNADLQHILDLEHIITTLQGLTHQEQQFLAHALIQIINKSPQSSNVFYQHIIQYLQNFAPGTPYPADIKQHVPFAQQIFTYLEFEQSFIFENEKRKSIFLQAIKHYPLPDLINFWNHPIGNTIVASHIVQDNVKVQSMIVDMAIMMGTQMGAEGANRALGDEQKELLKNVSDDEKTVQNAFKAYQANLSKVQGDHQKKIIQSFQAEMAQTAQKQSNAQATEHAELDYLHAMTDITPPTQSYIFGAPQDDMLFTLSPMFTPQGPLWRNPYTYGNWMYNAKHNSFMQYHASPMYQAVPDDTKKAAKPSALFAPQNSIFTEYYTNQKSYTITGTMIVYKVTYPFCAGIIFNKARFIAGNSQVAQRYRLLALYGTSPQDVGFYYAEQHKKGGTSDNETDLLLADYNEVFVNPLSQIIGKKPRKVLSLSSKMMKTIHYAPMEFNFTITTTPTTVSFKIWQKGSDEPKDATTYTNLNPNLYLFHGIGFLSPGAVAEFSISSPSDLVFSSDAIKKFKSNAGIST